MKVVHLLAYEKFITRTDQTMMRDSWREVDEYVVCDYITNKDAKQEDISFQRTNDIRAVTCPVCKESDVFTRCKDKLTKLLGGSLS